MKWLDIISENDLTDDLRQVVLNFIQTYTSMGIDQISLQQLLDQIKTDSTFNKMNIDKGLIMKSLQGFDNVAIEIDPDTSIEMIKFTNKSDDVGKKSEEDKENIQKAAQRTIDKELK